MDSLTQIVLGAACGELALGKKIGNKALLFGAIGGTIPDLDVYVGRWIYDNEIDIMAFHRGFMHSIVFAILGAFFFGWLVHKLYDSGKRK
jgi:inner membrane protein